MRIVASTQGRTLDLLAALLPVMERRLSVEVLGIYVADALHFRGFADQPLARDPRVTFVPEWEITAARRTRKADWREIERFERQLGDPTFWNAIVADRRLAMGRYCKYRQDYRGRFDHEELGAILSEALERVDALFERLRPQLVLGFGMVTLGDYLFHLFARAWRIPFLQLKSAKLGNHLALNEAVTGVPPHVARRLADPSPASPDTREKARALLREARERGLVYEGAIRTGRARLWAALRQAPRTLVGSAIDELRRLRDPVVREDTHLAGILVPAVYKHVVQPLRAFAVERGLRAEGRYVCDAEGLDALGDFAFYPLHFEPEVALQVFGRPYQNQIELVRNLAQSLPFSFRLVVKEHPRALGFRSRAYYRKLLDIPNVYLLNAFLPANVAVRRARLVAVVSGTIGFEAAAVGKPVLTFGPVPYNALGAPLVRRVVDLNELGTQVRAALDGYSSDVEALERYVGAVLEGSVPVDLYSNILRKRGRTATDAPPAELEARRDRDLRRLGEYFADRIAEVSSRPVDGDVTTGPALAPE